MSTQHNEVRFRQGTNDADMWLKWRESHHVEIADSMLREYQKRDSPPDPPAPKLDVLAIIRSAANDNALLVDARGVGKVHLDRLRDLGINVQELRICKPI